MRAYGSLRPSLLCLCSAASLMASSGVRGADDVMIAYGVSTDNAPRYRTWTGSAWSAAASAIDVGGKPLWLVLRGAPSSGEFVLGVLDSQRDINVQVWNGSTWGSALEATTNADRMSSRVFDIAYEQASGHALLVYKESGSSQLRYRTWDGSAWSAEQSYSFGSSTVQWLKLVPKPGSDEIIVLEFDYDGDEDHYQRAAVWNGSAFASSKYLGGEEEIASSNTAPIAGAYESTSGAALVAYLDSSSKKPRYRTWDGSAWSGESSMPSVGSRMHWLRMVADPLSDEILFGSLDSKEDVNVNVWDGSSWGTNLEVETSESSDDRRGFDIAYEGGGGEALLVYEEGGTSLRYRTWTGAAWSAEAVGPSAGAATSGVVQAVTGPSPGQVFVTFTNNNRDIRSAVWDGSGFGAVTSLGVQSDSQDYETFMVARAGAGGASAGVFTDVSTSVGFDLQTTTSAASGSALLWADYDNDGDLDAVITGNSSSRLMTSASAGQSFTATTFGGGNRSGQAAIVDIDNDGDIDVWHRGGALLENDGSASFADSGDLGLVQASDSEGMAVADADGDGYCDIVMFDSTGNWLGHHTGLVAERLAGTVGSVYGLNDSGDFGAGGFCSTADVNDDGILDFFYYYGTGRLFLSDGDGTYTENAGGISVVTTDADAVGGAWGDYDNDGDADLFVPRSASGQRSYLWRNVAGVFSDVTVAAGISDTSAHRSGCWGDYDNDGDLDLYICTAAGDNILYQNQGDSTFLAVDEGAGANGSSHDAVFVDYDNDGDLDLAVTRQSGTSVLLQNGTDDDSYLKVRVIGHGVAATNKAAVGVRVELYQSDGVTYLGRREIGVSRGYGGTQPLWAHFGGVDKTGTYVLKVHFASGVREIAVVPQSVSTTIGAAVIGQMLTVEEGRPGISRWVEVEP